MQWPPVEPSYTGAPLMPPPHPSLPFALEPPFLAPPAGPQPSPPQLLSGHRNERELQLEAAMSEAVRFVSNLLANRVPRRRVQGLGEQLLASLIAHLAVPNRCACAPVRVRDCILPVAMTPRAPSCSFLLGRWYCTRGVDAGAKLTFSTPTPGAPADSLAHSLAA